jgi:hypothetical protein
MAARNFTIPEQLACAFAFLVGPPPWFKYGGEDRLVLSNEVVSASELLKENVAHLHGWHEMEHKMEGVSILVPTSVIPVLSDR